MTEKAKEFLAKVSSDDALKAEIEAALKGIEGNAQYPVVVELAKKKGFDLTVADFDEEEAAIDLDEAEAVAGGAGGCGCAFFGFGAGSELKCTCVSNGTGYVGGASGITSQGGCICIKAGAGATNRH